MSNQYWFEYLVRCRYSRPWWWIRLSNGKWRRVVWQTGRPTNIPEARAVFIFRSRESLPIYKTTRRHTTVYMILHWIPFAWHHSVSLDLFRRYSNTSHGPSYQLPHASEDVCNQLTNPAGSFFCVCLRSEEHVELLLHWLLRLPVVVCDSAQRQLNTAHLSYSVSFSSTCIT
jgi:hypothetical protein